MSMETGDSSEDNLAHGVAGNKVRSSISQMHAFLYVHRRFGTFSLQDSCIPRGKKWEAWLAIVMSTQICTTT